MNIFHRIGDWLDWHGMDLLIWFGFLFGLGLVIWSLFIDGWRGWVMWGVANAILWIYLTRYFSLRAIDKRLKQMEDE